MQQWMWITIQLTLSWLIFIQITYCLIGHCKLLFLVAVNILKWGCRVAKDRLEEVIRILNTFLRHIFFPFSFHSSLHHRQEDKLLRLFIRWYNRCKLFDPFALLSPRTDDKLNENSVERHLFIQNPSEMSVPLYSRQINLINLPHHWTFSLKVYYYHKSAFVHLSIVSVRDFPKRELIDSIQLNRLILSSFQLRYEAVALWMNPSPSQMNYPKCNRCSKLLVRLFGSCVHSE